MLRKLRVLGGALASLLAASSLVAPGAFGNSTTEFTPEGNHSATIKGAQIGSSQTVRVGPFPFTCKTANVEGEIAGNTTDMKLIPDYQGCHTIVVFGVEYTMTATINECYYTLTGENTVEAGVYGLSMHLECPVGQEIILHIKRNSEEFCTARIKPQTLTGITATNVAGEDDDVVIHTNALGQSTLSGMCIGPFGDPNKETGLALLGDNTWQAFNGPDQVDLTVSHATG
jgi:hypothetical protein